MAVGVLIAGLVVFLGAHCLPMAPRMRERLRQALGEGPYKGVFTLVSLIGFALIVYGYGFARSEGVPVFYAPPAWTRHLTMVLMLPVFVLLLAAYLPGNISAKLRHPMVAAVKIWAFAHLLSNGDAASLLLFLSFLAWAVADRLSLKRRAAVAGGSPQAAAGRNDSIAVVGGLVLYGLFVWRLHGWLIGVPLS